MAKVLENFHDQPSDLAKYVYLTSLQDRNERLFYDVVMRHLTEMLPIIYTPTVGRACQLYGHIWRRAHGLFITSNDRGRIERVMRNWAHGPVRDRRHRRRANSGARRSRRQRHGHSHRQAVAGHGVRRVTDEMFLHAAYALAEMVTDSDRQRGSLFPPLERIRDVSAAIAAVVARIAYQTDVASTPRPVDLEAAIRAQMYLPKYD